MASQSQNGKYAARISLCLSHIVGRVCRVVYKFVITQCHKIKTHNNSYQCSLFHPHEIHLCTCSYRIPWCCYKQHCHYSCVLRWHTRLYLKQQRNPTEKRLIEMVWLQTFRSDIVCLPNRSLLNCHTYKSYKVTFDNLPMPGKIKHL